MATRFTYRYLYDTETLDTIDFGQVIIDNPENPLLTSASGDNVQNAITYIEDATNGLNRTIDLDNGIRQIYQLFMTDSSGSSTIIGPTQRVTPEMLMFFENVDQDGERFDLSSNVFVNPSNVITQINTASGTPYQGSFIAVGDTGSTEQTVSFGNQALQFAALVGGTLTIALQFQQVVSRGFVPQLVNLELIYGATTFTFPIDNIDPVSGSGSVSINIPNNNYFGILDTDCEVRIIFNERGASFQGNMTIGALFNTLTGTLHTPIVQLTSIEANNVESRLNSKIAELEGRENDFDKELNTSFAAIEPRISPTHIEFLNTQETSLAYFADSTGVDAFPVSLASMTHVTPDHPDFVITNIAVFVAVPISPHDVRHQFNNITAATLQALTTANAGTDPDIELGESFTANGDSYGVYRISGLTASDVVQVVASVPQRVVDWPQYIDNLEENVEEINQKLDSELFNIPAPVVGILRHDITVNQDTSPTATATDFNRNLGTGNNAKVLNESPATQPPSGGITSSNALNASPANTRGEKLFVLHNHQFSIGSDIIFATRSGEPSITVAHITVGGVVNAIKFIPAQSAGTTDVTVYPAPSTRVSGAGIWQTIEALTFINGIPVAEADELFFTRNVPTSVATLTIQYRGHANGNVFSPGSTTLAGVGGASNVSTTFNISAGSETATIEVVWRASNRDIRVSITERVNTGLPTINDVQVILSFVESRTVPGRPETTQQIRIANFGEVGRDNVIIAKPSENRVSNDGEDNATLILVGNELEVDTGYNYDDLFGDDDAGGFDVVGDQVSIYNVDQSIEIIPAVVRQIEARTGLPFDGFFTEDHTFENVVTLDTQFRAKNPAGDDITLGDITGFQIRDVELDKTFTITVRDGQLILIEI